MSSLIFRATKPFHPARLHGLVSGIATADVDERVEEYKKGDTASQDKKTDEKVLWSMHIH